MVENSQDSHHGKQLCEVADVTIKQAFQNLMATIKVSELPTLMEALEKLPPESPDRKLIEMVKDETVQSANTIVGGMVQVIEGELRKKSMQIKLNELDVQFLD